MKVMRLVRFGVVALALCLFSAAPLAHADVNNFTINSFDANDTLTNADRQGQLHVVERIDVQFTDFNHGILRAIPTTYKKHQLQLHINAVSSETNAPAKFSTYGQNGNLVLKIGDASKTVTGHQEYTIDYTVRNVIGFYPDHDELYWDINGDQWAQWTSAVSLNLHLPEGLKLTTQQPVCYAGRSGSTEQLCAVYYDQGNQTIVAQTDAALQPYQTLSVVAGFDKGYFHPSAWYETALEYQGMFVSFLIPFALIAGIGFVYWFTRGRDPRGRGVIVPEYEAPDKLSPIEVGTIIDFHTDNRDITATIIDMAVRGYIKIIELKKDKALGHSSDTYSLLLVNDDYSKLNEFEATLMFAIFAGLKAGSEIDLGILKNKFAKVARSLRIDVNSSLLGRGYFRNNPQFVALSGVGSLIFSVFIFGVFIGPHLHLHGLATIGCIAGSLVAVLFLYNSSSRTAKGVEAKEHVLGLKMYMEVAEAQRLKMLQSPNARYAEKGTGPSHTVDLFEKLLPYAMALGIEKQWAKQFADIYRTPPDWYSGNWTTFNVLYLTTALSSGVGGQINSAFSAPSNSGSSGFGGGGFSGGGGGGGGGGGW